MHQECDRCGVYASCNKDGICNDCLVEEFEDGEDREEEEETPEEG